MLGSVIETGDKNDGSDKLSSHIPPTPPAQPPNLRDNVECTDGRHMRLRASHRPTPNQVPPKNRHYRPRYRTGTSPCRLRILCASTTSRCCSLLLEIRIDEHNVTRWSLRCIRIYHDTRVSWHLTSLSRVLVE